MSRMYRLPDTDKPLHFLNDFVTSPEGLLAVGGNLHPETLLQAYKKGIFPCFGPDDPILWWHPDPRLVLYPQEIRVSRSLRQLVQKTKADPATEIIFNRDFLAVIKACATVVRHEATGTWITDEIQQGYLALHDMGYAHSVEVWQNDRLVAGLYGVAMGKIFFGESMFTQQSNLSKLALVKLCEVLVEKKFLLIDCQQQTRHLQSLGAVAISRPVFLEALHKGGCADLHPEKTVF